MRVIDELVPTPSRAVHEALQAATLNAIDRRGYVPCHMATATRNATVTEVLGVACYSKTDLCPPPLPAGAHAAESHTPAPVHNGSRG